MPLDSPVDESHRVVASRGATPKLRLGGLARDDLEAWRHGREPYLERMIDASTRVDAIRARVAVTRRGADRVVIRGHCACDCTRIYPAVPVRRALTDFPCDVSRPRQ